MTAEELFHKLAPLLGPRIERDWHRRDLCVLATRIAMDVGAYFGIPVEPLVVRVIVINRQFARHVERGELSVREYQHDGSYSVGCGFNKREKLAPGMWNGHMVAQADGWFGDFSISQAERPEKGIITGPAVVGPLIGAACWHCENEHGTMIEYSLHPDPMDYRRGPDWRKEDRRRRIVGDLIREVRNL